MDHPCSLLPSAGCFYGTKAAPSCLAGRSPSGRTHSRERSVFPLLLLCQTHGDSQLSERSVCTVPPAPAFLMWEVGTAAAVRSQRQF